MTWCDQQIWPKYLTLCDQIIDLVGPKYLLTIFDVVEPQYLTWCHQIFDLVVPKYLLKIFDVVEQKYLTWWHKIFDLVRPNGWKRNISVELAKHRQTNVLCVTPDICHCHQLHHQHHNQQHHRNHHYHHNHHNHHDLDHDHDHHVGCWIIGGGLGHVRNFSLAAALTLVLPFS